MKITLLFAAVLCVATAWADIGRRPPLAQLLEAGAVRSQDAMPDATRLAASPTRAQQLPLFRAVMAGPLDAPHRAAVLADSYAQAASVHALVGLTGVVAGLQLSGSADAALAPLEAALRAADDPLAASLRWMAPLTAPGSRWPPPLPDTHPATDPLRFELALVLSAMEVSHRALADAFAGMPAAATPGLLRRQALEGAFLTPEEPDLRQLLGAVDRQALMSGMLTLVAAVERLQRFVVAAPQLPPVSWRLETPMGQIVVDTTGADNRYLLQDSLLVLDVGGDDRYRFLPRSDSHRISVLLDHGGNDRYEAAGAGADPSSATLGLGILWDTEGDDHYLGTQQAQASALFGAALLVDGGGDNHFAAGSHAQAHAIVGLAVLRASPGNDRFTAQTHAQGSAGPLSVAVLIDPSGNDRYTLDNAPLSRPSSQLPGSNTSMGQGAGRGWRTDARSGRSAAGGIGMLIDLAGDDHYLAQVFSQGVGYHEGLGLLVDNGGNNRFEAAWYAMGAAAHDAAGLLLKRGTGDDSYRSSHSISLGAAHDLSVGIFLDEGGDDAYAAADLSLGAAHDNSIALFTDAGGHDSYQLAGAGCRAFGVAHGDQQDSRREDLVNLGLFMDLGGVDHYPPHCGWARNDAVWTPPPTGALRRLRSQAGAGIDGYWASPFGAAPGVRAPGTDQSRD